jgi:hypothetical protein
MPAVVRSLRRDQREAASGQRRVVGDEADTAAALRDLVDGGAHAARFSPAGA